MDTMLEQLEIAKELIEIQIAILVELNPEPDDKYIKSQFERLKELHQKISEKYDGGFTSALAPGGGNHKDGSSYTVQMNLKIEARSHQKPTAKD